MKKLLGLALVAGVLGAVSPALAGNGAMDLSWNKCDITAASTDKSYACDGAFGSVMTITGSFVQPFGVPDFAGVSAAVDVGFAGPVPDYWKTLAGECNAGALTLLNPATAAPCGPSLFDPNWSGGGFSAVSYPAPNRVRFRLDWATGVTVPPSTLAGVRYAGFALSVDPDAGVINHCTGCEIPACIVMNAIEVYGFEASEDYVIDTPNARNWVTWQGGVGNCPGATPSRNRTWGSVKALYR